MMIDEKLEQLSGWQEPRLSLRKLVSLLGGEASLLLIIILSIPFAQPIQLPGLSTPFGLLIAFFGVRVGLQRAVCLPAWLLKKEVTQEQLHKLVRVTVRLLNWIKKFTRPILPSWCGPVQQVHGWLIALLGLLLALPLPVPFSNMLTAGGILAVSIGLLFSDFRWVLAGYMVASVVFLYLFLVGDFLWHFLR